MTQPYENEALKERFRTLMEEDRREMYRQELEDSGVITPEEGRVLRTLDKAESRGS